MVLCTSDRGLCGGFNVNLIDKANSFVTEKSGTDTVFSFTNFGRRGKDWCRKENYSITDEHIGVVGTTFNFNVSATSGRKLVDGYLNGDYDEVHAIFSEFISMGRQTPVVKQLIPIPPIEAIEDTVADESEEYQAEHICEPHLKVFWENCFRKVFMFSCTVHYWKHPPVNMLPAWLRWTTQPRHCNDFIENLTLVFNKARQAAITAELMDIVGGAEALKG